MKKISLDLDALQVDSFATDAPLPEQGTVQGHADTFFLPCQTGTCGFSCGLTCGFGSTCLNQCPTGPVITK